MMNRLLMALGGAVVFASAALAAELQPMAQNIAAALSNPMRPADDKARDADRKPADMLAFAEVKDGDEVAELVPGGSPGGGYFTRLFSRAVGKAGHVYAVFPTEFDASMAKRGKSIPGPDSNYSNVSVIHQPLVSFTAPVQLDIVWTSQNYHDLHDSFTGPPDIAAVNKAIFSALKPGGVFIVLDHAAADGSGLRDTDTLHRIDEAAVKKEVEAAGFVLDGEDNALRNPKDPRTAVVFDPSVRGHTDQFILKFRKPR